MILDRDSASIVHARRPLSEAGAGCDPLERVVADVARIPRGIVGLLANFDRVVEAGFSKALFHSKMPSRIGLRYLNGIVLSSQKMIAPSAWKLRPQDQPSPNSNA